MRLKEWRQKERQKNRREKIKRRELPTHTAIDARTLTNSGNRKKTLSNTALFGCRREERDRHTHSNIGLYGDNKLFGFVVFFPIRKKAF